MIGLRWLVVMALWLQTATFYYRCTVTHLELTLNMMQSKMKLYDQFSAK